MKEIQSHAGIDKNVKECIALAEDSSSNWTSGISSAGNEWSPEIEELKKYWKIYLKNGKNTNQKATNVKKAIVELMTSSHWVTSFLFCADEIATKRQSTTRKNTLVKRPSVLTSMWKLHFDCSKKTQWSLLSWAMDTFTGSFGMFSCLSFVGKETIYCFFEFY